ncbi:MAG TPA: DUF2478 domain-containing protein [Caulobacteraceae bacterium]|nr:DUF2478 domain-containing protein [Caulobacteraceae bacterium]
MSADKPIAVLQGAATPVVQAVMRAFIARLAPGVRAAGVVEDPLPAEDDGCSAGELKSLGDGRRFPLLQDLASDATACRLDSSAVVSACDVVQRDIAAGCDLVVLSKFGKVEAQRSGLAPAFASAMEASIPILTSVSPKFGEAWDRFAAPLYVILPPELAAVEAWWAAVRAKASAPAP